MILDKGICSVFRKINVAEPGRKPVVSFQLKHQAWYGQLDFSSSPSWATERREETRVDMRIRILQNAAINNHDIVVLRYTDELADDDTVYEVVRAFHGHDDDTAEPITDLSLEVVGP